MDLANLTQWLDRVECSLQLSWLQSHWSADDVRVKLGEIQVSGYDVFLCTYLHLLTLVTCDNYLHNSIERSAPAFYCVLPLRMVCSTLKFELRW